MHSVYILYNIYFLRKRTETLIELPNADESDISNYSDDDESLVHYPSSIESEESVESDEELEENDVMYKKTPSLSQLIGEDVSFKGKKPEYSMNIDLPVNYFKLTHSNSVHALVD